MRMQLQGPSGMVVRGALVLTVVAASSACASGGLSDGTVDRALATGQGHVKSRDWQTAIQTLEPLQRHPFAEGDQRRTKLFLMLGRAHRELGQPAEALVDLDASGSADPAVLAERQAVERTFLDTIKGAPSVTARLSIRDGLPVDYVLLTLGLVLDGHSILFWQRAEGEGPPPPTMNLPVTASTHVLRIEGSYEVDTKPVQTMPLSAEWVLTCSGGGACEAAIDIVDHGGPLTPFGRGVAADFKVTDHLHVTPPQPMRAAAEHR
jgi:hypothetical protein